MNKINALAIVAVSFIVGLWVNNTENNAAHVFEKAQPSIVQIKSGSQTGTGIFVGKNLIVTNKHVIDAQFFIKVKIYNDAKQYNAQLIGESKIDLAILKISDNDWNTLVKRNGVPPALDWKDSNDVNVGDRVWSLGYPLGISNVFSEGIVSKKYLLTGPFEMRMLYDGTVLPGNSGGPVLDKDANIIGITTAFFNGSKKDNFSTGNSFAALIPATIASRFVDQLLRGQETTINSLNILLETDPVTHNVKVIGVTHNSDSWKAGLSPGDELKYYMLSGDSHWKLIVEPLDVQWAMYISEPGEILHLKVKRGEILKTISIKTTRVTVDKFPQPN